MENNQIAISYESQDIDAAEKLSKDLTNKGFQAELVNYDTIEKPADLVKYSHFLALLSQHPEKLADFFHKFFTELEFFLQTSPNFLIPIATDDSYNETKNPEYLPAMSTPLSFTDYDNCLSRILKIIHPPQLKDIDKNKELSFQWTVTSELFKLPEDTRIEICRQFLGINYGLDLPTNSLCKKLLEECNDKGKLDELWEKIQSCQPEEDLIQSSLPEKELDKLLIEFYDSRYLTVDQVGKIASNKKEKSCIILLAGLNESGKTTLITSIYEYFQRGLRNYPYLFAGSKTFHELEQLCYLSRIISDGNNQNERTLIDPGGNENFLHFRLRDKDRKKSPCNVFLSDFPGELFKNIKKEGSKLDNMKSFKIAHQILYLINGADLISDKKNTYTNNSSILRTMLDYVHRKKMQSFQSKHFYLIISKWDLIQDLPVLQRNNIIEYVDRKLENLKAFFQKHYHLELKTDKIAARPSKKELTVDQNIVRLIRTWIEG